MFRNILMTATLIAGLPALVMAKDDDNPPQPTRTTKDCFQARQWDPSINKWVRFSQPVNGVWDANLRKCVRPDRSSYLGEDTLYDAVRELAYFGRTNNAYPHHHRRQE